jgi:hypothetical protein
MPERAPGFEIETVMNIRMAKAGLRVVEVPSYEELRGSGQSNLHAFRDGFRILWALLRERFRRKPRAREESATESLATAEPLLVTGDADE